MLKIIQSDLEIGFVFLTTNSCILHIVQFMSRTDIENIHQLNSNSQLSDNFDPYRMIQEIYSINSNES